MNMITRRHAIKLAAVTTAAIAATSSTPSLLAQAAPPAGPFTLPPLPYAFDALEPFIDAQTMQIHHDKHHAAYVANLNKDVAGHEDLGKKPVEDLIRDLDAIPENIRTAVRNHGGGHANHSLFWQLLAKDKPAEPKGALQGAIEKKFGGYDAFKDQFSKAAAGLFGSGWVWLTVDSDKQLLLEATSNQDTPLSAGRTPLLTLDVWEHAYYLKYQNRRPEYIAAFFKIINWDPIADKFEKAIA
jgi:superoxide dismutase, Fe-Mn family